MRELKVQIGNSCQRAYRVFPDIFRTYKTMTLRTIKSALVFGVAIFYSFVVFNNVTDYNSNYQFERHVMMMDSTFPGNHGMWRAINTPLWHTAFYVSIIAWETLTMILCWWGGLLMVRALRGTVSAFNHAKRVSLVSLALSLTMWLVVFLSVGGEWFLMWQSKSWNGQEAAFRMFAVVGIVLLVVAQPEIADQP
jgi:predicted small integral membrane protein